MESLLFGMFTICILGDQRSVMTTNEAKIDRLKSMSRASGSIDQHQLLNSNSSKGRNENQNHSVKRHGYHPVNKGDPSSDISSHENGSTSSTISRYHTILSYIYWDCCVWNEWQRHPHSYLSRRKHSNGSENR